MRRTATFAILPLLMAMAACETQPRMVLGPDFGNSVRHNMALQIINPEPAEAGLPAPDLDGARAAGAMERYKAGEVTPIEVITTTGTD